jgi:tetratricopeptide (TPR) repeat protein
MVKIIILIGLVCLFWILPALASDWQSLHNRADNLTVAQAQAIAERNPDSAVDQYVLALIYLNLYRDQEAEKIFDRLRENNPDLIEAVWGKAEVLRRRHQTQEAQSLLSKVIETDPQFAPALNSLAYIKYFQADYKAAINLVLRVIEPGKDKVDLSNYVRALSMYAGSKGMLAHYGGILSKAIDGLAVKTNLDKAQRLQPNSPAVLFGLGSYYLLAPPIVGGDRVKAENYLKQAINADPLFADAYVRLGQLAKLKGSQKDYEDYLAKALEIDPQNELALDTQSRRCRFICP